jgi:hypothetical protein
MGGLRGGHTATLLPGGNVLVVGGSFGGPTSSAELYDPDTARWTTTGAMDDVRYGHTATLLSNGTAGWTGSERLAGAELYDPSNRSWIGAGAMVAGRQDHTATLLLDGTVLAAGGNCLNRGCPSGSSAELYDPTGS